MATILSEEQQRELDQHRGKPIPVVHPETHQVYFLIAGDLFERLRPLFDDGEFDIRETYAAQFAALDMDACWNAPGRWAAW